MPPGDGGNGGRLRIDCHPVDGSGIGTKREMCVRHPRFSLKDRSRWQRAWFVITRTLSYFFHTSPQRILLSTFSLAILLGTLLLMTPWAQTSGRVGWMEALFTATSAVCVTGLIVVDTGTAFTVFGQAVILLLIQVGGLGIMTFAAVAFQLGGARMPLAQQSALEDSFFQRDMAMEFSVMLRRILKIVFLLEGIGALVLFVGFCEEAPLLGAVWLAVFHAVSAFCNAGFSLYSDSLMGVRGNGLVIWTVMLLIVTGGLGHVVLLELYRACRDRWKRNPPRTRTFSLHTRVVLWTSAILVGLGALLLWGLTRGEPGTQGLAGVTIALFQSVTARTAGFNTAEIGAWPLPPLLLLVMLMMIGGSPGSCAGGIKTTTFAIWFARIRAALHGQEEVTIFGRMIPKELVLRSVGFMGLAVIWNLVGVFILSVCQPTGAFLRDLLFEQVSAFATVGLSTGITPELTTLSRLWIILTMLVGRIGPLTLVLSFLTTRKTRVGYPEGRVMIG